MCNYIGTNGFPEPREVALRDALRRVLRTTLRGGLFAFALCAFFPSLSSTHAFAQSASSQLVVDKSQSANSINESVTSVVFTDAWTLTLINGQELKPVFLSKTPGAKLVLGNSATTFKDWSISRNSPSWTGSVMVYDGMTLNLIPGASNPLGVYSENNLGNYGSLILSNGATFEIPQVIAQNSIELQQETRIGRLETGFTQVKEEMEFANVIIGSGQTLTVENGIDVSTYTGLAKKGKGTLQIEANGQGVLTPTGSNGYTTIKLGDLVVEDGTFRVKDGTADVDKVEISADSIILGDGATLDIQKEGAILLGGESGDVVFAAEDGSTVNFYIGKDGYTNYVASTYNTYITLGNTTLDVSSELIGDLVPQDLVVFSAGESSQTSYTPIDLTITDNILGKNYAVNLTKSNSNQLVLSLIDSDKFVDYAPEGNAANVAAAFDSLIASGKYSPEEYLILSDLESHMSDLNWEYVTGENYASEVAFHFMNTLMTRQALFNNLRNNALVSYSETAASTVSPQDYDAGRIQVQNRAAGNAPVRYGAANGAFEGPLYYNSETNSYAPGVVPTPTTGIYNGETIGGYGDPNSYGLDPQQFSSITTMRGQAQYGDPGTLIYSAWFEALGSALDARTHKDKHSYEGKQVGLLAGLDLFGSCDCRFGAYYGYQYNKLDSMYGFHVNKKRDGIPKIGYTKTDEHQVGLYHQFGDEDVYSIGVINVGYARYNTRRYSQLYNELDVLTAKHDTWNAGVAFERGMNFKMQPLTISPYAQIDYNYFNRPKFKEQTDLGDEYTYALSVRHSDYHSLRGQVGARVALDLYPGDQRLRVVGNAAYVHEFLDGIYGQTKVSFTGMPDLPQFNIYGNSLGRDWAILGLGGEWDPIPALNLFVRGDYILNKYTRNPGGSAGVKYRW